jgi:cell division protein FtsI/penicillin-binding protein 2
MPRAHVTFNRITILYSALLVLALVFSVRLFQLQIVDGQSYADQAVKEQLKKYEIPAERGRIYLREGERLVPLVLNQNLQTLYADPNYVTDPAATAQAIVRVVGGDVQEYEELLSLEDSSYVILRKRLSTEQSTLIDQLELEGVGLQDAIYRTYPEGPLAAQTLGFVNDDGVGQYGVEGALDIVLAGTPGLLSAVTDVNGIPLATSEDAVILDAVNGEDVVLTIDRTIQQYVEQALAAGVERSRARAGSALVLDPNSGAVLAMANYPTYEPNRFFEADDASLFLNGVVQTPYEVGSVAKPFTMAAALQENAVEVEDTYYDPGFVQVDDRRIENAGSSGGVTRTMTEVIQKSVNTGVIYALDQLSGGSGITYEGRSKLYDYFYNKYGFGQLTGIEQSAEATGSILSPDSPEGNNVRYANMTFGQGMTITMMQLAAGFAPLVNGGTYYQPYLVDSQIDPLTGQTDQTAPKILRDNIISEQTSREIQGMMEKVVELGGGISARRSGYVIGGKTGTAQKLSPDGTYSDFLETGTFIGYGAGDEPEYIIVIKIDEPDIPGYAGSVAAAPIFADISNWLIDYRRIAPVR